MRADVVPLPLFQGKRYICQSLPWKPPFYDTPKNSPQIGPKLVLFFVAPCLGLFFLLCLLHQGSKFIWSVQHLASDNCRPSPRPCWRASSCLRCPNMPYNFGDHPFRSPVQGEFGCSPGNTSGPFGFRGVFCSVAGSWVFKSQKSFRNPCPYRILSGTESRIANRTISRIAGRNR